MTVTGATTAQVASVSYTPPYKYVTSYPPAVQITGTVTGPIDNNPTAGFSGTDGDSQYAWAYLKAHMMSDPSYVYAYILWMALGVIALIYTIAHHARLGRGSVAANLSRWSMKRYVIGSKKPGKRNRALPSNGMLFVAVILAIPAIALSVIGSDYIKPSAGVFTFARSIQERSSPTAPKVTINKSLWTLGSRFGFIAFALMPLVVLLALKAPPVAFLSLRPLTHLYADKLAFLHRATAWLIWGITTAHVVLWTVQLFEDSYKGIPTWVYLWGNYRFICGAIAYFALTGVMVLSIRPVRKHQYELFYSSHVVLVAITIGACAAHHPVLWYWMAAAAALWIGERAMRYLRFAHINKLWGRRSARTIVAGQQYSDVAGFEYGNDQEPKHSTDFGQRDPHAEKAPRNLSGYSANAHSGLNTPRNASYYDDQIIQPLDQHSMPYADPYGTGHHTSGSASTAATLIGQEHHKSYSGQQSQSALGLGRPPTIPDKPILALKPPPVPAGYAQAQLLPSRTIRLTVNTPRSFKWAAGQSCLLYLPELSKFQSHPFTIMNNSSDTEVVLLVKARKGLTRRLYNMIRTRSLKAVGVTGSSDRRLSVPSMTTGGETGMTAPPVHVRAWVDGPFGSAGRVHWNEFSTVTIICGGSGVSFGAAVCDYVCRTMANRMGRRDGKYQTKRVRFCWVAREYAEIVWIAGQLYQCTQMVSQDQLQINIFVTQSRGNQYGRLSAPKPGFMKHSRRDSSDSVMSEMSAYGDAPADETYEDPADTASYADVIDLTNYDDEEDVNDPAEMQLSDRLHHQGKVQRAKSRRAAKGRAGRSVTSPTYTPSAYPPRRSQRAQENEPSLLAYTEPDAGAQYDMAASGAPQALLSPPSARFSSGSQDAPVPGARSPLRNSTPRSSLAQYGNTLPQSASMPMPQHVNTLPTSASMPLHSGYAAGNEFGETSRPFTIAHARNDSFRSVSDSTYARYDPYAVGPRIPSGADYSRATNSPAPSIWQGDDGQSIAGDSVRHLVTHIPRTGSMIFLENDASDPSGDAGLWIDEADYQALNLMTEMASVGKPKLASVLEEEIERAEGRMIVATCGPVTFNTVVRNLVARHISPSRMRHGDKRGHIAIYSEDYES